MEPTTYKFLLTGLPKSGKSTIERIIFGREDKASIPFLKRLLVKVVDLPENAIILEPTSPAPFDLSLFEDCLAVLYVVDITNDYVAALSKLCALVVRAKRMDQILPIQVLLHKADAFTDTEKQEILKDVSLKLKEEMLGLFEEEVQGKAPDIRFHLSSIFDSSLSIALSKVVQMHIPECSDLVTTLDTLCTTPNIEKAFLFDSQRKLFVAVDSSPFSTRIFEVSSVILDMLSDLNYIYSCPESPSESPWPCLGHVKLPPSMIIYHIPINQFTLLLCVSRCESGEVLESTCLDSMRMAVLNLEQKIASAPIG